MTLLHQLGLNRIPDWILGSQRAAIFACVSLDFLREEMANGNLRIIEPLPKFRRIRFVDLVDWFEALPVPRPQRRLEHYEESWRQSWVRCSEQESERDYAHALTHHAFKLGILVREPCEICGRKDSEAHHDDYLKPLEVRFLCRPHHFRFHRGLPYDYEPKYRAPIKAERRVCFAASPAVPQPQFQLCGIHTTCSFFPRQDTEGEHHAKF
jgi:hypothetical protein